MQASFFRAESLIGLQHFRMVAPSFGGWLLILVKQLIRARVLRFLEGLLLLGCGLSSASETAC